MNFFSSTNFFKIFVSNFSQKKFLFGYFFISKNFTNFIFFLNFSFFAWVFLFSIVTILDVAESGKNYVKRIVLGG